MLRNTDTHYGWLAITLHWLIAVIVIAMFAVGLWMDSMDDADRLHGTVLYVHKSIGVSLFALVIVRLAWRLNNPTPKAEAGVSSLQQLLAKIAHWIMYAMLFVIMFAGYFIATAENGSIEVFGLFDIPAAFYIDHDQEEIAEEIHELAAYALIILASVHALAALKHHFYDKNNTLKHMLGFRH
ncbi:MAG: cytochrome b [Gammaproteobacteria bacterium]|nr:cytochrome b [Gammaproteobacteria bacterium]